MTIEYIVDTNVNTTELDDLWKAIGWRERGSNKWVETLTKSSYFVTAQDRGRIIGCGRMVEDGMFAMFFDIAVHPDYQSRGIGRNIVTMMVNRVKDQGYAGIHLFAWEGHPANIPFYESLGFERTSSGMELTKYMKPE